MSHVAALHAWHLIDQGKDFIQIGLNVVSLVRDDSGELEVDKLEDGGGYIDGSLGSVGDLTSEEPAGEEGAEARSIQACANDELVSSRGIVDNTSLKAVLGATEVLVGNVVEVLLTVEISSSNFSNGSRIIETKTVEGIVLLGDEDVSKSEQVARESVDVLKSHFGQGLHVQIKNSVGLKVRAPTETDLGLGNTEDGGGDDT